MLTLTGFLRTAAAAAQTLQQTCGPLWPVAAPRAAAKGGSGRWSLARLRGHLLVDSCGDVVTRGLLAGTLAAACVLGVAGCGNGPPQGSDDSPGSGTLTVMLVDVLRKPVEGADVTLSVGSSERGKVTTTDGVVTFKDVPIGPYTLAVRADGFEPISMSGTLPRGGERQEHSLIRVDAWTIGPAIILGTRMVDRSASGDSLLFSVDVAVIAGKEPEPLETLTASDFSLAHFDCGWGGPRDCASDADGKAALGYGNYRIDGQARAFSLQPRSIRRPYLAGVVAERSGDASGWDIKARALQSFLAGLGAADAVGLASVQLEQGATTFTALGAFTRDGGFHLEAIDRLASTAIGQPSIEQVLPEAIHWITATSDFPDSEATLLWLSRGAGISLAERDQAVALALQAGLHVSAVTGIWTDGDLGELAMRTGGFVSRVDDVRQYGSVFGVMDQVLAGTLPYYRIEYRLTGEPGLFSPGGNVRVYMRIDVPAAFGTQPVYTSFDVGIPP
jgi:hypothetical protein